jgi:N-acetylneuraminic acid mutarotase
VDRTKRTVLIVCIFALIAVFMSGCQTQSKVTRAGKNWKVLSPIGKHVYGMTTAVLDNKIHLLGGVHGEDWTDPVDFHQVYDPTSDSWSLLEPIPDPCWGIGWGMSAVYGGQIYLFGGGSGPGLEGSVRAWVYDPIIDAWSHLADMPVERINGAAVTAGDYIYIFGGHRDHTPPTDELISAYRYDPSTDTYERVANMPETATFITRSFYKGYIYAISGLEHEWLGQPSEPQINYVYGQGVLKYDVAGDSWTKLDIPRIRQRTYTLTQLCTNPANGSKLFVLGGKPPGSQRTNLAAYFDMETETFGQIDPMPKGRCCGSSAVVNGKIYVSGGFWADVDDVYDCTETWGYPLGGD